MKKAALVLCSCALVLSMFLPLPAQAAIFPDVPDGHWAQKDIEELAQKGIISGKPNGRFDPNGHVTRGQFALMLYRALQLPVGRASFRDVPSDTLLGKAVGAIVNQGIANGYPDKTFKPNQPITRGQMAVMITRALGYEIEAIPFKNASLPFKDRFVETQRGYIKVVSERGIIRGTSPTTFSAGKPTTRAQAAAIINRMLTNIGKWDDANIPPPGDLAAKLLDAAKNARFEDVKYYLEAGANPNARDHFGKTPLMYLSRSNEMVTLLLKYGANPNLKDNEGNTALTLAMEAEYLHGTSISSREAIKTLIENGADPKAKAGAADKALYTYTQLANTDMIKFLIQQGGISPNIQDPDYALMTPLILATLNNYQEMVKVLLECGANPNLKDKQGRTALSIAKEKGFQKIVDLLTKAGAKDEPPKDNEKTDKLAIYTIPSLTSGVVEGKTRYINPISNGKWVIWIQEDKNIDQRLPKPKAKSDADLRQAVFGWYNLESGVQSTMKLDLLYDSARYPLNPPALGLYQNLAIIGYDMPKEEEPYVVIVNLENGKAYEHEIPYLLQSQGHLLQLSGPYLMSREKRGEVTIFDVEEQKSFTYEGSELKASADWLAWKTSDDELIIRNRFKNDSEEILYDELDRRTTFDLFDHWLLVEKNKRTLILYNLEKEKEQIIEEDSEGEFIGHTVVKNWLISHHKKVRQEEFTIYDLVDESKQTVRAKPDKWGVFVSDKDEPYLYWHQGKTVYLLDLEQAMLRKYDYEQYNNDAGITLTYIYKGNVFGHTGDKIFKIPLSQFDKHSTK